MLLTPKRVLNEERGTNTAAAGRDPHLPLVALPNLPLVQAPVARRVGEAQVGERALFLS